MSGSFCARDYVRDYVRMSVRMSVGDIKEVQKYV